MTTNRVEFVSYDGEYPNYCSGTFVLRIDDAIVQMPKYSIRMNCGKEWGECFDFPKFLEPLKNEVLECINKNVECYHCHGCD